MTSRPRACHRGFTLVELLVVITIIGILAGLALVGVRAAVTTAQSTAMKVEVNNIATALDLYKQNNGAYPPDGNTVALTAAERETAFNRHLAKLFPQRSLKYDNPSSTNATDKANAVARIKQAGTDHNIVNTATTSSDPYQIDELDPTEAYVLFLMGFSPDVEQPLTGSGERTPLFEFDQARLVDDDDDGWWSYHPDFTETLYVYFNNKTYDDGATTPLVAEMDFTGSRQGEGKARPYATLKPNGTAAWAEDDKFQLICAGLDGHFGSYVDADEMKMYPSGIADTSAAPTSVDYSLEDFDNIVNFGEAATLESDTDL
ncbi:hypothetical protein C5Y96_17845 [Blastopirellula marina]|uniref:Prepilin-type cleavage/methylation domain-containing protein n=1 Tax=Blastopirellula marina TaxID=124 RepID=A0A2S8F5G6_9BACT|nr:MULTISPECIES: prepilin-type N-terminal cleavage/methylation domain-containing protein [Pirellulaceae]PQO27402.1 hypothetical protein C5Y96_17845 [Blastopirellula marina]RCS47939.1 prepilin-type N-terminal cleavage/methylation domain-containing protein [Bremerella cremea]